MKKIFLLPIVVLALSCRQEVKREQNTPPATPIQNEKENENEENLDWLVGNWKRLNNQDGKETFENWEKINSKKLNTTEYAGIGFTLQKADTISQEHMSFVQIDGNWTLFVKTPDEKDPIKFKMTTLNNNALICTNDSIDFPKRIEYKLANDTLKAKVSNEEMEVVFEFKKLK